MLNSLFKNRAISCVCVMEVPIQEVSKYGIVGGKMLRSKLMHVQNLVEKPAPEQSPSRFAIPGRYLLSPLIFDCLRSIKPGKGGEIQLTDALQLLASRERLLAYEFEGTRYDSGDRLGFIDATLAFALKRAELNAGVRQLMRKHLENG